jgi:dTDP-L-rhamnose 4-epimerase
MVGHGVDLADAPEYVGINELGTAVLLAQLARADIGRLVLASSMVVYGEGAWRCAEHGSVRIGPRRREHLDAGRFDPTCPTCGRAVAWSLVDESAPLDPRSVYAASKASQEFLSSAWQRATGGSVTALRYHNVYGPRMPQDTPYSGVAAMFRSSVERGETPRVFEDGQQMRDFVHVTDVARANLLALHRDEASMVSLNVCSGQPHSIGDLAAAISAAAGGPPPQVTGEYRLGDVRHIVASGAGAEQAIGFIAERDFPSGAAQFASDPLRGSARIGGPRPVTT